MSVFKLLFTFAPLIQSVSSTMKEVEFKKSSNAGGLVSSDHVMFDSPARSKLSCLGLCALDNFCLRFTYTGEKGTPGTCQGHSTRLLPSNQGTVSPGATAYDWTGPKGSRGEPYNAALHKVADQDNVIVNAGAINAVDGDQNTVFSSGTCTHTERVPGMASWWQVDLADLYDVTSVIITNRGDCCGERLHDFDVHAYANNPVSTPSEPGTLCSHYDGPMGSGVTEELVCDDEPIRGRFVRITNAPEWPLTLCEVQVIAEPAIRDDI